jgi:hypothetical protein
MFRRSFGEEEKFGSITRSAKLYSTTGAVFRVLEYLIKLGITSIEIWRFGLVKMPFRHL